jgi:DNA-binding beta-propeller fold protein YncE
MRKPRRGNGPALTVIDGKTNATTTFGNIGKGSNDLAVNALTNRVYVTTANPSASSVSVFSGVPGDFPRSLMDQLLGATNGVR